MCKQSDIGDTSVTREGFGIYGDRGVGVKIGGASDVFTEA